MKNYLPRKRWPALLVLLAVYVVIAVAFVALHRVPAPTLPPAEPLPPLALEPPRSSHGKTGTAVDERTPAAAAPGSPDAAGGARVEPAAAPAAATAVETAGRPSVDILIGSTTLPADMAAAIALSSTLTMASIALPVTTMVSATLPGAFAPVWNTWLEQPSKQFTTVQRVTRRSDYVVRLQLAPGAYDTERAGVVAPPISPMMKKWLDELADSVDSVELDAVLIYDTSFFEPPNLGSEQRFTLDVKKLRSLRDAAKSNSTTASQSDYFTRLGTGDRSFVIAGEDLKFEIQTKDTFPRDRHWASVALSIWDPKTKIPIDEVSMDICAGSDQECTGVRKAASALDGLDGVKVALGDQSMAPEVAIHVLPLKNGYLWGVMSRGVPDRQVVGELNRSKYLSWPIKRTFAQFKKYMEEDALPKLASRSEEGRLSVGENLLGTLMPSEPDQSEPARSLQAYYTLLDVVQSRLARKPYAEDVLPTLYFRVAVRDAAEMPTLWPWALMSFPFDPADKTKRQFLGRAFRIESPLTSQSYEPDQVCVSDWKIVGPARTGTTEIARSRLNTEDASRIGPASTTLLVGDVSLKIVDRMNDFHDYMHEDPQPGQPPLTSDSAMFISVLSHHNTNELFFIDNEPGSVSADQINRTFLKPSIVLLNGCGTAGPGASALIGKLNSFGIQAVIATLAEVEPEMAGDFLDCFIEQIETAPAEGIRLGVAHTKALRCLEPRVGANNAAHASRALFYGLLGNTGLRLCPPTRKK